MAAITSTVTRFRHALGLLGLSRPMWGFYHVHIILAGVRLGAFEALQIPQTEKALAAQLSANPQILGGWLTLAADAGAIKRRGDLWSLTPWGRRHLLPDSVYYLGYNYDEAVSIEGAMLDHLPGILSAKEPPEEDHSSAFKGAMASLIFEPFAFRVLESLPIRRQSFRVLDVGCGHGDYLRFIAKSNPTATGVGIEITERGVGYARQRIENEGLSARLRVIQADATELQLAERFDLCLLNNNLYYFEPSKQVSLFSRLREHLADGGVLAVQTPVYGRGRKEAIMDVFHLYLIAHKGTHGVPQARTVDAALREAGFGRVRTRALWPWSQWVYFLASR